MFESGDRLIEGEVVAGEQIDFAPDSLMLFGEDESGKGMSPSCRDREEHEALLQVIADRLCRARRAANLNQLDVARRLGHANLTMISLFENGHRSPSLKNIQVLADMYQVTTDYLLGRTDSLGLSPEEGNQALITGVVGTVLTGLNMQFLTKLSEMTAIAVEGASLDRVLLGRVADTAVELKDAMAVIRKHHGDQFDNMRGGSKVARLIDELCVSVNSRIVSKQREKALMEYEHPVLTVQQVTSAVQQALFSD